MSAVSGCCCGPVSTTNFRQMKGFRQLTHLVCFVGQVRGCALAVGGAATNPVSEKLAKTTKKYDTVEKNIQ